MPATITRDDVLARNVRAGEWWLRSDRGGSYEVMRVVVEADGVATGYARGERTGALVAFRTTGRAVRQGMRRCRITPLVDSGDAAGHLVESTEQGFGGLAPLF